jgi:hypothetical protein
MLRTGVAWTPFSADVVHVWEACSRLNSQRIMFQILLFFTVYHKEYVLIYRNQSKNLCFSEEKVARFSSKFCF